MCLGVLSSRGAALADALGLSRNERPGYADEPAASQTMQFVPPGKKLN